MNAIKIEKLKKYFGKTRAVDGVSFDVEKGEIFGFLGPNGAGKTTTIRCMIDFVRPTSGKIQILQQDSVKNSIVIKEKIGYLSGDVRLYENWTGQEHINFLEKIRGKLSIAKELMAKIDFNPKMKFKNLSTGNRQKLGLILALMFEPELLILDEPTVGLDPLLQNMIYKILEDFQKRGSTIFMSSHNLSEVERICNRVAIIKDGKLAAIENILDLKNKRMHLATVHFAEKFNKNDFIFDCIEIQQELDNGLILNIKGDINPLIKKIAKFKVKDLEITHASLEEIFLEFYEK